MALLTAAFVTSLVLGISFVVVNDSSADDLGAYGIALSDDQAAAQVVDAARQIVTVAQLRGVSGAYAFMSCKGEDEPPYQAAFYMNFRLPQTNSARYLREVAAAMVAHGWTDITDQLR